MKYLQLILTLIMITLMEFMLWTGFRDCYLEAGSLQAMRSSDQIGITAMLLAHILIFWFLLLTNRRCS